MGEIEYPQNEFTRMIEDTASGNRAGGARRVGVAMATPMPTVHSADLGREVPAPLTEMERAELDLLAVQAGVRDERLGPVEPGTPPTYATLDEAVAAGAPLNQPIPERRTAREFIGRQEARLPDFRRVEGIDLLRNRAMVDNMEFPITEQEALDFKKFVIATAREAIMRKLSEAADLFASPEGSSGNETMPEMRRDQTAE